MTELDKMQLRADAHWNTSEYRLRFVGLTAKAETERWERLLAYGWTEEQLAEVGIENPAQAKEAANG